MATKAKRGPAKGWKKKAAAAAAVVAAAEAQPLSASDRENPAKLSGQALRDLGYRRGLARSEMALMSDEKIREQLKYVTYRQYETEVA